LPVILNKPDKPDLYIGLMAGTSVDAIDAALVSFDGEHQYLESFIDIGIPESLKQQLLDCNLTQQLSLVELCTLQKNVADLSAQAVSELLQQNHLHPGQIHAIGSHGQTIYHAPEIGMSLQVGHPAHIAKKTGIATVADFRVDDMALGGQGAPFAPVYHQQLFAQADHQALVVNIGGIANLSIVNPQTSTGFDTGPGNGLIDSLCQTLLNKKYDADGQIARSGQIHQPLLDCLLQDRYFDKPAPKSTGRDYFNSKWLQTNIGSQKITASDLIATVTELTALSIARAVKGQRNPQLNCDTLWVCGGGAHNRYLLERIQHSLQDIRVLSTEQKGIDPNAIEAMLLAWLAKQRMEQKPVALCKTTGAQRDAILGGLWLP
jgi:anhydro-N-acetylmuramic acid kinase